MVFGLMDKFLTDQTSLNWKIYKELVTELITRGPKWDCITTLFSSGPDMEAFTGLSCTLKYGTKHCSRIFFYLMKPSEIRHSLSVYTMFGLWTIVNDVAGRNDHHQACKLKFRLKELTSCLCYAAELPRLSAFRAARLVWTQQKQEMSSPNLHFSLLAWPSPSIQTATALFSSSQEPPERDRLTTFYIAQRANHTRLEFAKTRGHEISLPWENSEIRLGNWVISYIQLGCN